MEDKLKKTLESGAVLEVTLASFDEGQRLYEAVFKEMEKVRFNADFKNVDVDLKNLTFKDLTPSVIDSIKNTLIGVIISPAVKGALWECLARATYARGGVEQRITKETFEPVANRGDWFIVAKEVLWFNLRPFFPSAASLLKVLQHGA